MPTPRDALSRGPLRNEYNGTLIVERSIGDPVGTVHGAPCTTGRPMIRAPGISASSCGPWPRPGVTAARRSGCLRTGCSRPPRATGSRRRRTSRTARATLAREGRLPARGDHPSLSVPCWDVPRSRHVRDRPLGPLAGLGSIALRLLPSDSFLARAQILVAVEPVRPPSAPLAPHRTRHPRSAGAPFAARQLR